jgi:glyoxylase-like metal-dependent hydrolase (beta-lactamase superfamily II)
MGAIPLEDNYTDVVGKAQRGLSLSDAELARQAGLSPGELSRFKGGGFDPVTARKVAGPLQLGAQALLELGEALWYPEPLQVEGLAAFNTSYRDMTVNSFLVFDPKTLQAAAFDTGSTVAGMLASVKERQLTVAYIFLTHSHSDHVADLQRLEQATGATAYIGEKEQLHGAKTFAAGQVFRLGGLKIETRQTSGHARGGITYVVSGLARRLAIVGDALCRLDGRRGGFVRGSIADQSQRDFQFARRHHRLSRPRSHDHRERTKEAQSVLSRISTRLNTIDISPAGP